MDGVCSVKKGKNMYIYCIVIVFAILSFNIKNLCKKPRVAGSKCDLQGWTNAFKPSPLLMPHNKL